MLLGFMCLSRGCCLLIGVPSSTKTDLGLSAEGDRRAHRILEFRVALGIYWRKSWPGEGGGGGPRSHALEEPGLDPFYPDPSLP